MIGNIYDITEVYLEYKHKYLKICEKECENQFIGCRDVDGEEKEFISMEN